jgi:hypothetical protein
MGRRREWRAADHKEASGGNHMKNRHIAAAAILLAGGLAVAGCSKLGPQERTQPPAPDAQKNVVYKEKADLSKPEGPMYVLLQASQENDPALFKTALAPDAAAARDVGDEKFRKFRKKVLTNKVTPVPESVQMVNDTEAVVKLRNARGREIPVHVKNYDGKWLITGIDLGAKTRQGGRQS